jgi:CheY-like chemotaxis protein
MALMDERCHKKQCQINTDKANGQRLTIFVFESLCNFDARSASNVVLMKKRILVVDDEALITESISSILQSTDLYEVETTTNAYEAFERAIVLPFDLVISDLMMPGMNGDTLYLCLGVHPEDPKKIIPRPKLLLISGVADEIAMNKKREFIGAADILQKPFTSETLLQRVHKLLFGKEPREGDTMWRRVRNRIITAEPTGKW